MVKPNQRIIGFTCIFYASKYPRNCSELMHQSSAAGGVTVLLGQSQLQELNLKSGWLKCNIAESSLPLLMEKTDTTCQMFILSRVPMCQQMPTKAATKKNKQEIIGCTLGYLNSPILCFLSKIDTVFFCQAAIN